MAATPRPRRSSAELRELIIDAGLVVLYKRGLRATASHVPMTEALAELERSRDVKVGMGSIFGSSRLWPSMKEFQLDLLLSALNDRSGDGPNETSIALAELIPDVREQTLDERMTMLVELSRAAGTINGIVPDPDQGRNWLIWVSIWATAMNDPEVGDLLRPQLRLGEKQTIDAFSHLYGILLERLGLRLKPPYTLMQFATIIAAMTDGMTLRAGIIPEQISNAPSRHPGDWNLLGTGMAAIALEFLEDAIPGPG